MKKKILAAMLAACVLTAIPAGIGTSNPLGGGIVQTASAYGGDWWPGSGWWPSDDWWDDDDDDCWDDDDDDCWDDDDDDCWDDDDDDHNQAQVTSITLDKTSINKTFEYGEGITDTVTLTATVETKGHGNVDKTVKWSSSDSDVASVQANWKKSSKATVTFKGIGTAYITAKCGGKTATCKVTVKRKEKPQVEVAYVEVTPNSINKEFYAEEISGGQQLNATVYKKWWQQAHNQKVTWKSSKPDVATVDKNGYVTFKGFGTAIITATAGGKSDTCTVTIKEKEKPAYVTEVTVNPDSITKEFKFDEEVTGSEQLTATVQMSNGKPSDKKVTWSSSNESVAKVDRNGKVTFVGFGTARITASVGNVSDTCTVTINVEQSQIGPISVRYVVEHYKANGYTYTLVDTEYLTGEIGEIVTAAPKDYEGFVYNANNSNASGTLKEISGPDDIVTLRLYYDVEEVEEKELDFSELLAAMEKGEAKFADGCTYTEETLKALNDALIEAGYVYNSEDLDTLTQDDIDEAADAVIEALKNLEQVSEQPPVEEKELDFSELLAAIEKGEAKFADGCTYTEDTLKDLKDALNEAGYVYNSKNLDTLTQDDIDEAADAVIEALENLKQVSEQPPVEEKELDFSGLLAAMEKGEAKFDDGCTYTEDTLKALKDALIEADYVYNSKDLDTLTQDDINKAEEAVNEALRNLQLASEQPPVEEEVDKSKLASAIQTAEAVKAQDYYKDYTDESKKVFEEALEVAKKVMDDSDATQDAVNIATAALVGATNGLTTEQPPVEEEKVDKSALADAIDKANTYINAPGYEDKYTEDSRDYLLKVYNESKAVYEDENATQDKVDAAADALNKAVDNLKPVSQLPVGVNKHELTLALGYADKAMDEGGYTAESLANLKEVYDEAWAVWDNDNATQAEVDSATEKLNAAIKALVPVSVDKSALKDLIWTVNNELNTNDYTKESVDKVLEYLKKAQEVYHDEDATQDEVNKAYEELSNSMDLLVKKPGRPDRPDKPDQDQGCIDSIEDLIDEILDMIHKGEIDKDDAEYIIEIINRYFGYGHWYDQDELDHLLYWLWCQMDHAVVVRPSYTVSAPAQTLDGWKYYNSGTLYYNDGIRTRGFAVIDGDTYYFDRQGFMQTGWVWVSDDDHEGWWYFDEDGRMVTGWLKIGNVWYYLDTVSGRMYDNGLAQIGGVTYYFFNWGGMANDWWYQASDGWYFFQGNGAMQRSGWRLWKGSYYYLTASGLMATNTTTPDGYYVNANGVWVK